MRIYLKNIPDEFHSDLIWKDGAFGFLRSLPQEAKDEEEEQQQQQQQQQQQKDH